MTKDEITGAQWGKRPVFADYLAHRAAARAIESAVHQQYAEWLEKQEPVAWQHQKPIVDNHGQLLGYSEWKDGKGGLSFWPHRKLFIHPSRDTGLLEQVRDFILARSEHAQECDVFDLDDNGRHKACSCGLAELVTTLHERLEQQT